MTDFGRRPGVMLTSVYDADQDGVIDPGASYPHTHVHAAITDRDADGHIQYHTDDRGDARYVPIYNVLANFLLADMYEQIIQGTWLMSVVATQLYFTFTYNASAAQNDEIEYSLFAEAGAKTLYLLCYTSGNRGITHVYLDDVLQGEIDMWSNAPTPNVHQSLAMTVVGTKQHSLKLKMATKRPVSTGYILSITYVRIK